MLNDETKRKYFKKQGKNKWVNPWYEIEIKIISKEEPSH